MSWSDLPILPLCRLYEYLDTSSCIAAASTCHNWRYALYVFHRLPRSRLHLTVSSESGDKNSFLANLFSRRVRVLEVTLASSIDDYSRFVRNALECFCDSKHLLRVTFKTTPEYITFENTHNKSHVLNILTYILKLCELRTLTYLNIHGSRELAQYVPDIVGNVCNKANFEVLGLAGLRVTQRLVDPLIFDGFNNLRVLSLEYDGLSEGVIMSMEGSLPSLTSLILCVVAYPPSGFRDLSSAWDRWRHTNPNMEVTLNCICLPSTVLEEVNQYILRPSLPLAVLRVLFCKTMSMDILNKLVFYGETLKQLHWADSVGCNSNEGRRRSSIRTPRQHTPNPLVMMCWRCPYLQYITIHGYWYSSHDLLGMARLRGDSLRGLSVSALLPAGTGIYTRGDSRNPFCPAHLPPKGDSPGPYLTQGFIQKMKCSLNFPWKPSVWSDLHPALLLDPQENLRLVQDYILETIAQDIPSH